MLSHSFLHHLKPSRLSRSTTYRVKSVKCLRVQGYGGKLGPRPPVLSWQEWHQVWSSAAVALFLHKKNKSSGIFGGGHDSQPTAAVSQWPHVEVIIIKRFSLSVNWTLARWRKQRAGHLGETLCKERHSHGKCDGDTEINVLSWSWISRNMNAARTDDSVRSTAVWKLEVESFPPPVASDGF